MDMIEKTAKVAAEWWGERLETGDRASFEADLSRRIVRFFEANPTQTLFLENDYDPKGVLLEAVRATVDPGCRGYLLSGEGIFPQKHSIAVEIGSIEFKEGYVDWTDAIQISAE